MILMVFPAPNPILDIHSSPAEGLVSSSQIAGRATSVQASDLAQPRDQMSVFTGLCCTARAVQPLLFFPCCSSLAYSPRDPSVADTVRLRRLRVTISSTESDVTIHSFSLLDPPDVSFAPRSRLSFSKISIDWTWVLPPAS